MLFYVVHLYKVGRFFVPSRTAEVSSEHQYNKDVNICAMDKIPNYIIIEAMALLLMLLVNPGRRLRRLNISFLPALRLMSASIMIALCFDISAMLIGGRVFRGAVEISLILKSCYFAAHAVYAFSWLQLTAKLDASEKRYKRFLNYLSYAMLALEGIIIEVNFFTGWVFTIGADNYYHRGIYYPVMLAPFAVCLFTAAIYIFIWLRHARCRDDEAKALSLLLYALLPTLGSVLQIYSYGSPWLWPMAVLSLLMLEIAIYQQAVGETNLHNAIRMMGTVFYKIVEIDLDTHKYVVIKNDLPDNCTDEDKSLQETDGFTQLAKPELIFEEDKDDFLQRTSSAYLISCFDRGDSYVRIRYRRLISSEYRWVSTEILRQPDYSQNNRKIMVYVRDINDEYINEVQHSKQLEFNVNHDMLTGLHSHSCFANRLTALSSANEELGVIYADLNNLKAVNDMRGHSAGDLYIKRFADIISSLFGTESCYRISGDEFAVIMENIDRQQFDALVLRFRTMLEIDEYEIASFGDIWCRDSHMLDECIKAAENKMYSSKESFYKKHSEMNRRRHISGKYVC